MTTPAERPEDTALGLIASMLQDAARVMDIYKAQAAADRGFLPKDRRMQSIALVHLLREVDTLQDVLGMLTTRMDAPALHPRDL